jgi:hypothetical protein
MYLIRTENNMIRTKKQYDTGLARAIRILNGSTTQDTEDSFVDPSLATYPFPYQHGTIKSALKNA